MRDMERAVAPNYEAMYHKAMEDLEKVTAKNHWLNDELKRKDEKCIFLEGFRSAVELIFGKGGRNENP